MRLPSSMGIESADGRGSPFQGGIQRQTKPPMRFVWRLNCFCCIIGEKKGGEKKCLKTGLNSSKHKSCPKACKQPSVCSPWIWTI